MIKFLIAQQTWINLIITSLLKFKMSILCKVISTRVFWISLGIQKKSKNTNLSFRLTLPNHWGFHLAKFMISSNSTSLIPTLRFTTKMEQSFQTIQGVWKNQSQDKWKTHKFQENLKKLSKMYPCLVREAL